MGMRTSMRLGSGQRGVEDQYGHWNSDLNKSQPNHTNLIGKKSGFVSFAFFFFEIKSVSQAFC